MDWTPEELVLDFCQSADFFSSEMSSLLFCWYRLLKQQGHEADYLTAIWYEG
jgi:hypothetical protein